MENKIENFSTLEDEQIDIDENKIYKSFLDFFSLDDNLKTRLKTKFFISGSDVKSFSKISFSTPNLNLLKKEIENKIDIFHFFSKTTILIIASFIYSLCFALNFDSYVYYLDVFSSSFLLFIVFFVLSIFPLFVCGFSLEHFSNQKQLRRNNLYVFYQIFLMSNFADKNKHNNFFKKSLDYGYLEKQDIENTLKDNKTTYDEAFDCLLTKVYCKIYQDSFKNDTLEENFDKLLKEKALNFLKNIKN